MLLYRRAFVRYRHFAQEKVWESRPYVPRATEYWELRWDWIGREISYFIVSNTITSIASSFRLNFTIVAKIHFNHVKVRIRIIRKIERSMINTADYIKYNNDVCFSLSIISIIHNIDIWFNKRIRWYLYYSFSYLERFMNLIDYYS